MSSTDQSALLQSLDQLAQHPPSDEVQRRHLANALRKAYAALESPLDVVHRIAYSPLQLVIAKLAVDLGIFLALGKLEIGSRIALDEIVKTTGGQPTLIARILRFLAANGLVSQVTESAFAPNTATRALSQPGFNAAIKHHFDAQLPAWSALPSFLARNSYQTPTSAENTAFQVAHSTPLTAFQFAAAKPELMADFAMWMAAQRQDEESWLKVMKHEDLLAQENQNKGQGQVLLVDIGGGMGHQSRGLRTWLPAECTDGIVLQDLPPVLAKAGKIEGVDMMPYDFFTPQPVKGAKFYYLRNVFHDYSDSGCRSILHNIKDALATDSKIIVDELVLPTIIDSSSTVAEVNASLDILLMASLAGQERTEEEWRSLFRCEGLEIQEVRQYDHRGHSVLVVGRASSLSSSS